MPEGPTKSAFSHPPKAEQLADVTIGTSEAALDEKGRTVRPMRRGRWRQTTSAAPQAPGAVLAGVLLLALLAAACTSGDGDGQGATAATAPATSAAPATTSTPT